MAVSRRSPVESALPVFLLMPEQVTSPAGASSAVSKVNLRTQKLHLELIFNSARDMMLLAQVDAADLLRVVSVNRPYIETIRSARFNLSAQDFEGRTFAEVQQRFGFDAETVARLRANYEHVIRTRLLLEFDEVTRAPKGVFHGRTTITPILNDTGECAYVLYSSQNVTAHKQAEQAQRESEAKFIAAFRVSPDLISISDFETGRYLEVNGAHEAFFGYKREEMIGRTPQELNIVQDDAAQEAILRDLEQTGHVRDFRVSGQTRDGRAVIISVSAEILTIDGRKCVLRASRDVTVAVHTEQALRESEEKFTKAFKSSPDAISVHEFGSGRYVEVNDGLLRMFGWRREDIIGRTPIELGVWSDATERENFITQLRREGTVRNYPVRVRSRSNKIRLCEISAEMFEVGGQPHNVTVLRDVTEHRRSEQALRESEEKFARAFRASPDAISISELESGRLIDINEGFEKLSGYTRSELIGRTAEELGLWAEPGGRNRLAEELQLNGSVRNLQLRVQNRFGEQGDFLVSGETVEIGERKCLVIVAHDIRDRLRAEQALRESEEKFATAFRASAVAMSIVDLESHRYVEMNQMHEELFGYPREEFVGRTPAEVGFLVDPTAADAGRAAMLTVGRLRDLETVMRTRRGEERIILNSANPIQIGGRSCALLVSVDITDRKRAEAALRESEEKFARAFQASPMVFTIVEFGTGRFIEVNTAFERLSGFARAEAIGRTTLELGLWRDAVERQAFANQLERDGQVRDLILTFVVKSGREVVLRANSDVVQLGGQRCILSVLEDITDQRRSEQNKAALEEQMRQNQKLEALGTLAGGIAHDFNNILTAIIVNQELALMDMGEPLDLRRRLAEIGQASNRAKDLVRQILTFSRQQPYERLRQNLQMIIREALSLLRASLPATIEISQELAPEAPPVLADASQIHQVVMNLCTNAAHAMRDRSGRLTVRLALRPLDAAACLALPGLRPGNYAHMTIADTGHGMDATVLARIFEPFFTTKGPGEGTGLGLPMVHGIMQNHDGGIFVHSLPGEGTTFDLYFPEAIKPVAEAPVVESAIIFGRGEAVLVVDDEEAICAAIGAMLRRIGYRVETFTDPRLALARFRSEPTAFNLLLTDRTMPHLSGHDLIVQVHDWWPGFPALLMSGMSGSAPQDDAAEKGGYRLVEKPIDIADLSRAVSRTLKSTPSL